MNRSLPLLLPSIVAALIVVSVAAASADDPPPASPPALSYTLSELGQLEFGRIFPFADDSRFLMKWRDGIRVCRLVPLAR